MISTRAASPAEEPPLAGFPDPIGATGVTLHAMPLGVPSAAIISFGARQCFNAAGRFCRNLVVGNCTLFRNAGSSISLLGFGANTHLVHWPLILAWRKMNISLFVRHAREHSIDRAITYRPIPLVAVPSRAVRGRLHCSA